MSYRHYEDWKGWKAQSFGEFSREDAAYFSSEFVRSGIKTITAARVMEIGFGNGAFAGWAKAAGAAYVGIERIPELVARARAAGYDAHVWDLPLEVAAGPETIDVVVAFDVLEHLQPAELEGLLLSARQILKENGRLLARVPSGDSPFARAVQHGDLTHRITLGSSAVRHLAAATGFVVEQVREPAFPLTAGGLRSTVRRLVVRSARSAAYPVIRRLFMADAGTTPVVLSPNMVFVLGNAGQVGDPAVVPRSTGAAFGWESR